MQGKVISSVVLVLLVSAVSTQMQWDYCKQCECRNMSIYIHTLWGVSCIQSFTRVKLTSIPLSSVKIPAIQYIYFSGHWLQQLPQDVFMAAGLAHIQAVGLLECHIKYVHRNAFRGMTQLIKLNLNFNYIATLDIGTFNTISNLKYLFLHSNNIQTIEDGLFENLSSLKELIINDNKITSVSRHAFRNTLKLEKVGLRNNKLTYMHPGVFTSLTLKVLWLNGNRWHCDCNLKPLFFAVQNTANYDSYFTKCETPKELHGRRWSNLTDADFICPPVIQKLSVVGNATVICLVSGNPLARVHWEVTGKRLDNKLDKYLIGRLSTGDNLTVWHNLTILNATAHDSGQYTCTANNSAGQHSRYVTLKIPEEEQSVVASNNSMDLQSRYVTLVVPEQEQSVVVPWMLVLYITLALLSVAIFAVLIHLLYTKCHRTNHFRQRDSGVPPIFVLPPHGRIRRQAKSQRDEQFPLKQVGDVYEALAENSAGQS